MKIKRRHALDNREKIILATILTILLAIIILLATTKPDPIVITETETVTVDKLIEVKSTEYIELPTQVDGTEFKITFYCACTICCGKNAQGITFSGKPVEYGVTIAVDPTVIPLGSLVAIEGYGIFEAQDTGSAIKGNIIDIYVPNHDDANRLGVDHAKVWILTSENEK